MLNHEVCGISAVLQFMTANEGNVQDRMKVTQKLKNLLKDVRGSYLSIVKIGMKMMKGEYQDYDRIYPCSAYDTVVSYDGPYHKNVLKLILHKENYDVFGHEVFFSIVYETGVFTSYMSLVD